MSPKKSDFIITIGRRKTSTARVRSNVKTAEALSIKVNDQDFKEYFNYFEWQDIILSPLALVGQQKADVQVIVKGGGVKAQAEAIRLGIARALVKGNEELRSTIKKAGMLTRDDRKKERKKPGLKKARRAPQWSKR